jgi:hypothetical protein
MAEGADGLDCGEEMRIVERLYELWRAVANCGEII